jgi:hypothetical protein
MGSISGLSTPVDIGLAIPRIVVIDVTVANEEVAYSFPVNTKHFKMYNDGGYIAKFSYEETGSAANYYPLYPGDEHSVYGISAPSVNIYLQSPGQIKLRIEIWT